MRAGRAEIGGRIPVNPSGGVLSSNPIGASGLIRFAEAAKQDMGRAGEYQVPDARKASGMRTAVGPNTSRCRSLEASICHEIHTGYCTESARPADRAG